MESKEGVELFVHFGIDTVELKGEGFTRIAQEGQSVKRGDTVIEFDLALLESKSKICLNTNRNFKHGRNFLYRKKSGEVVAGESVVLALKK